MEAPELMQDPTFRDFVVLYMAEGFKRWRNDVAFVNSDPKMLVFAHRWVKRFMRKPIRYKLQYHADHDVEELKQYWASKLDIDPEIISPVRKSNSNQLLGQQFRSSESQISRETAGSSALSEQSTVHLGFTENRANQC
jgi:hypothetical protein